MLSRMPKKPQENGSWFNQTVEKTTLNLCLVPGEFEVKWKIKKIWRKSTRKEKIKENNNRVKLNILFLFATSNQIYLF